MSDEEREPCVRIECPPIEEHEINVVQRHPTLAEIGSDVAKAAEFWRIMRRDR